MRIIKFKTFWQNSDFIEWQVSETPDIYSIIPYEEMVFYWEEV